MSDTFIPIGREETYLAKIAGYDVTLPPHPISREEHYLAKIAGEDVELPYAPISRDEHYLAKTVGQDVELPPYPISRDEFYLAKMAGEDVPLPPNPTSRISELLDEIAEEEPTPVVTLKTFDEANEEELVAMVQAADRGEIDLYEDAGWRVGQEREVETSRIESTGTYDGISWSVNDTQYNQTRTFVLMHKGGYSLVTPVKAKGGATRTTCSFVVGLKDCLGGSGAGYMSSSEGVVANGWAATDRRNWCNGGFRGSLPSDIRTIFKQFECKSWVTNLNSVQTTQDYFALPAEKEVVGEKGLSYQAEADALFQFDWYVDASNRIKKRINSATNWHLRSISSSSGGTEYYAEMTSSGTNMAEGSQTHLCGISPFGCV